VAASGYLQLVMPKVNPEEGHVRNGTNDRDQNVTEIVDADGKSIKKECRQQTRERLGESLLRAGNVLSSLKIVNNQCFASISTSRICDNEDDDDEPPPLI